MKILVFNWQDRLHPQAGGAEAHAHEIFSRLVRKGHVVHMVTCGFPGAPRETIIDGMNIHRIGSRSTYNFHVPFWWLRHGKGLACDVVVDDINKIPLMTPLFVSRPIVGIIHHLFGSTIYKEASFPAALYVNISERCIAPVYRNTAMNVVSKSTYDDCVKVGLPPANLHIIHNGLDSSSYPMNIGTKSDVPSITYFGRLKKYKSVDHVLHAFRSIHERYPTAMCHIIGKGDDEPRLAEISRELKIQDAVVFHGFVDEHTKVELLSSSWLVVNPSIKEGWGITNLEANACGTPVVSANSPGIRDSVKNDVSGILYDYGDIVGLESAITRIIENDSLRQRLSEGAIKWAAEFSWDDSADAMESLLRSCISS